MKPDLYNIPADVLEAERKISNYFKEQGITEWALRDIQSRSNKTYADTHGVYTEKPNVTLFVKNQINIL